MQTNAHNIALIIAQELNVREQQVAATITLLDDGATDRQAQSGAAPSLLHPLLRALIERNNLPVTAKLGWTDVARFAAAGIPAVNLGPGDSTFAHRADEHIERDYLDATWFVLADLLEQGV